MDFLDDEHKQFEWAMQITANIESTKPLTPVQRAMVHKWIDFIMDRNLKDFNCMYIVFDEFAAEYEITLDENGEPQMPGLSAHIDSLKKKETIN